MVHMDIKTSGKNGEYATQDIWVMELMGKQQ